MIIIIMMSFMVTLNSKPRTELNSKTVSFFVVICIHKTLKKSFENRLLAVSSTHCLFSISFYFCLTPSFTDTHLSYRKMNSEGREIHVLLHKN